MNWFKSTLLNKKFWFSQTNYPQVKVDKTVTVVIPAWNEEDFIQETIESILAQSHVCKIIVVNDASTDGTADKVREYSSVKLITTDKNQGSKSKALNYAIPFIDTEIFICVDADTILDEDAVEKLLMAFNDPETMIACGNVTSKEYENFFQSARYGEYALGQYVIKSAQQNANIVLVASGCFFAIKTEFLKDHPFNDRTMAEDMDLTWTAVEAGHRVSFVENAFCTVVDPHDFYTYDKQVSRWYRGFFQCIRARGFDLFSKNPKLGIIAYAYMIVNMVSIPIMVSVIAYAATISPSVLVALVVWTLIMFGIVTYYGWRANANLPQLIRGMFNSTLMSFLVYAIYIRSFVQEIILNKKLDVWVKGH